VISANQTINVVVDYEGDSNFAPASGSVTINYLAPTSTDQIVADSGLTIYTGSAQTLTFELSPTQGDKFACTGTTPPGMSFSCAGLFSASVTGTPTTPGSYQIMLMTRDSQGNVVQGTFTIVVLKLTLQLNSSGLPAGEIGVPYNGTILSSGGTPPLQWQVIAGGIPGLQLSPTGGLSGTPTAAGTMTVQLSDSSNPPQVVTASVGPAIAPDLSLPSQSLPAGVIGTSYATTIRTLNGVNPGSPTVSSGALPPGLALGGFEISGTPTASGTYSFSLSDVDSLGVSATQSYQIAVSAPATAGPSMILSNTQLNFWYYVGATMPPPAQMIGVSSTAGGIVPPFTATANVGWITITPVAKGFEVSVSKSGLVTGPDAGMISVTQQGAANNPQTINVTLNILASVSTPAPNATRFVPITPCRVADTRNAYSPLGGPSMPAQTSRDFAISSSACGVPSSATAYSLNVAVVPSVMLEYLTLWPAGEPQPAVATLNSDGRVKSNAAIVPAGANGDVSAFVTDQTDLVLDINGYFVPSSTAGALEFYPVIPCRIADTRNAVGPLGGPSLTSGGSRTFPIRTSSCGLPATAQAYSLNFAAVPNGPLGYLTAWPSGSSQPTVASLNAPTGTVVANAVIVPAGSNGSVDVYSTDATDLVIDVDGYFAPAGTGGLSLYTPAPCRVYDSRLPTGSPPLSAATDVNVAGSSCSVPAAAQAYVFNATVVPSGPLGYITLWPQGQPQPVAATLNALDGAITSNLAIVPANNGSISVFPYNPTHLVLDLFGYFAP